MEGELPRMRRPGAALEAARRAPAAHLPHQQAEVEGARVDQEAFEDVRMPAQVRPAHAAGIVDVRKGPLRVLPAPPQQPLAPRPTDAAAIAVDGPLRARVLRPVTAAALGLRDVRPDADGAQIAQRLIAVIPLVRDEFREG